MQKQFKPQPGIIPDYTSMVIDGYNYGNGLCKESRPDIFVVLNDSEKAASELIFVECGRLNIVGQCGTKTFVMDDIVRPKIGSAVLKVCCSAAAKHKVHLKCINAGNCDSNILQANLKKFDGCDTAPIFVSTAKDFACEDGLSCAQKVEKFVAAANALQDLATFSVNSLDDTIVEIEWKVAGERFEVVGWEGFETPEIVTNAAPAIGKGSILRNIFSDKECLPGACSEDKCYTTYAFKMKDYISTGDGLFSSTTGINSNNAFLTVHKTVWVAIESGFTEAITALEDIFTSAPYNNGYELLCSTECFGEEATKIVCISRTDAGNGAALTALLEDYSIDEISATLAGTHSGKSYYNVTVKTSLLPLSAVDGDTITEGVCVVPGA